MVPVRVTLARMSHHEAQIDNNATVDQTATIGAGSKVWGFVQVREGAVVGAHCIIGRAAYIDHGVVVGDNCKIQNSALIYAPATIGSGVFIGPGAILTNDLLPRAVNADLSPKDTSDWEPQGVAVETGASIGAGAVIRPGVTVGAWAMIGAGAVVTDSVPPYALMAGVPARRIGWVGRSGSRLIDSGDGYLVDEQTSDRFVENDGRLESRQ